MSHGVTPEPPTGSEQYREGWRTGYEQAQLDMRAELEQDAAVEDLDETGPEASGCTGEGCDFCAVEVGPIAEVTA